MSSRISDGLVLKAGDRCAPHEPGSRRARAAPRAAPATLREPAPDAGGRAAGRPMKRMFHGYLAVLWVLTTLPMAIPFPWRPPLARFFARCGRLPQGTAAGRGVESAKIATSARGIRSFPYPRKKFRAPESCPHFKALRTAHAARAGPRSNSKRVETLLNNRPRKALDYRTPAEVFKQGLAERPVSQA